MMKVCSDGQESAVLCGMHIMTGQHGDNTPNHQKPVISCMKSWYRSSALDNRESEGPDWYITLRAHIYQPIAGLPSTLWTSLPFLISTQVGMVLVLKLSASS